VLFCNANLNVPKALLKVERPKRSEPYLADQAKSNLPRSSKFDPALYDFCSHAYQTGGRPRSVESCGVAKAMLALLWWAAMDLSS
jgi:hypothetical protein